MAEELDRGVALALDLLGLEDGQQLFGELLDLGGATLFGVEHGHLQRDQGRVVGDLAGEERLPDLLEGGERLSLMLEPRCQAPLQPAETDAVQVVAERLGQRPDLGQHGLGLAVVSHLSDVLGEVEPGRPPEPGLTLSIDLRESLLQVRDRLRVSVQLLQGLGSFHQDACCLAPALIGGDGLVEQIEGFGKATLGTKE